MKIKKSIMAILMIVLFVVCLVWVLLHVRIYLPGRVIAEVVYADKDGFYGHDTLRYEDENGEQIIFHHASDGKIMAKNGDKVIVAGKITSYKESSTGEENSGLMIIPIWLAWTVPALAIIFAVGVVVAGKRYLKQKKALLSFDNSKAVRDGRRIAEDILRQREPDEVPFFEAESYEYNCKVFTDGSTARKQCLKLYKDYAVLYRGEWMDSAQLHEYEHIQKQVVKYTESIYIPYVNVMEVKYSGNVEGNFRVIFNGKDFPVDSPKGRTWSDSLDINVREMHPDELVKVIHTQILLPDPRKFVDMINNLRHKTGGGIATVEFLKESFAYSDYGENEGFPTMYFLNDINITSLLESDRVISLPYGIYKVYVVAYTYRVREGMPNSQGYKSSNTLELILNDEYSDIQVKIGRAIDSGEGRHLSVKKR